MAIRTRRSHGNGLDAWPGYVDALSTLLMVIIFVLLVFVLAQAFLTVALNGRSKLLDKATEDLAALTNALSLEKGKAASLQLSVSQLTHQLSDRTADRDRLSQALAAANLSIQSISGTNTRLQAQLKDVTARADTSDAALQAARRQLAEMTTRATTAAADLQTIRRQLTDANNRANATAADLQAARQQLAEATTRAATTAADLQTARQQVSDETKRADISAADLQAARQQLADLNTRADAAAADLATARQQLADSKQQLADMKQQIADLDRTVSIDKDTLQAKLSDLAKLTEETRALMALRDQLEGQAQDAAARAVTEQQRREAVQLQLADERKLGDSAKAQIALLNQQIDQLKTQLSSVASALELSQTEVRKKDVEIANLGQKLNTALAQKVEELQQYRSEFFGKLRTLLANRSGIQVVGDRFVFQSEVLYPVGSAELTSAGIAQMTTLAVTIKDIAAEIPPDIHWILRVDGHTDPQPLKGGTFASNWELSAARAIAVVKLLIADGVPPDHLAATGFGEYQPFVSGNTPDAYAKDRRIELRLTDR